MPTELQHSLEPTPSDGVVLVNEFRTMRLKEPTVDLHASENGVMIPVADGDANMKDDTVYEMDVVRDSDTNTIMIVKPRVRVAKKVPNSMDVIKRAITSTKRDPLIDAALVELISMSFVMRERVYTMA
jgi:hypothetical protein